MKKNYKSFLAMCGLLVLSSLSLRAQTYCQALASNTADEEIFNVMLNGSVTNTLYSFTNGCNTPAPGPNSALSRYSNFTTLPPLATIILGTVNTFSVAEDECDGAQYYANGCGVWIDWNQDGDFLDAGETIFTDPTTIVSPRTISGSFTAPAGALQGVTRMRVIVSEGSSGTGLTPCLSPGYGEVEDYLVNVTIIPCTETPAMTSAVTPTYQVCSGSSIVLGLSTTYTVNTNYQWQYSTISPLGPWTTIPNATLSTFAIPNATMGAYYSAVVSCTSTNQFITSASGPVVIAGTTTNSIPYSENFENVPANGILPNCSWAQSTPSPAIQTYTVPTTNFRFANSGNKFMAVSAATGTNYVYTNGLQLYPGITYSASMFYVTEYSGLTNVSDLSMLIGTTQSPTGLIPVASTNGAAVAAIYKNLSNTFTVLNPGIYYLAIRVTANGGSYYLSFDDVSVTIPCSIPTSTGGNISINSPTLSVFGPAAVCLGSPVNLTASGANTYAWTLTGSTYSASSAGISNTPNAAAPAIYNVVGTNTLTHCTSTISKTVNVNAGPVVSAFTDDADNGVCPGGVAVLHAVGSAVNYTWSTTGVAGANATVMPTSSSVYTVYGTNATNCISSFTIPIFLKTPPFVGGAPSHSVICKGESVALAANGASTYTWTTNTGILIGANVSASPSVTTSYQLVGTDANTGCNGTALVSVIVNLCTGLQTISASNSEIHVYPNPNNGEFTLDMNSNSDKTIHVTDLSGRVLVSTVSSDSKVNFNINTLSSGVYFVKIQTSDKVDVIKIVKE